MIQSNRRLAAYSGTYGIELELTESDARSACHQGRCDDDVAALVKVPYVRAQLDTIDPDKLRRELREYGAWDDTELADHDANLLRFVWLMAGDMIEELNQCERDEETESHEPGCDLYAGGTLCSCSPWKEE